jgi:hypothetical protein
VYTVRPRRYEARHAFCQKPMHAATRGAIGAAVWHQVWSQRLGACGVVRARGVAQSAAWPSPRRGPVRGVAQSAAWRQLCMGDPS